MDKSPQDSSISRSSPAACGQAGVGVQNRVSQFPLGPLQLGNFFLDGVAAPAGDRQTRAATGRSGARDRSPALRPPGSTTDRAGTRTPRRSGSSPRPPALRLIRNSRHAGSDWNRSTRAARSRVRPSRYSYGIPSRRPAAGRSSASKLVNCENTSALCPSLDHLGSRGMQHARTSPTVRRPRVGSIRPLWHAACRSRSSASRICIFDRLTPSRSRCARAASAR